MKNNDFTSITLAASFIIVTFLSWSLYSNKIQLHQAKKEQSALLKHYNKSLQYDVERLSEELEISVKRKPQYTDLYVTMDGLITLMEPMITTIEMEQHRLLKNKNVKIVKNNNLDSITLKTNRLLNDINQILKEVATYRHLSIRPKDVSALFGNLSPIYNRIHTTNLTTNSDLVSKENQLLELKNSILRIRRVLGIFFLNRVGATGCGPSMHTAIVSSTNTYHPTVGKPFSTEIILTNQLIFQSKAIRATIDGVPYKVIDGKIEYSIIPRTAGKKNYTVNLQIDNPFTGKIDNCRKTFGYFVK